MQITLVPLPSLWPRSTVKTVLVLNINIIHCSVLCFPGWVVQFSGAKFPVVLGITSPLQVLPFLPSCFSPRNPAGVMAGTQSHLPLAPPCVFEQAHITYSLWMYLPPCCPIKSTDIPIFPIPVPFLWMFKDLGPWHCWWDFKIQPRLKCQIWAKQLLCTVRSTHDNDLCSPLLCQLEPFV